MIDQVPYYRHDHAQGRVGVDEMQREADSLVHPTTAEHPLDDVRPHHEGLNDQQAGNEREVREGRVPEVL